MLHPSEIAKLVHVYLKDEGYSKSCDTFEGECQLLSDGLDFSFSKLGKAGANLSSILNDFLLLKETDVDAEKKEALSVLQALWKQLDSLIAQLKYASLKASSQSSQKKSKSHFTQSARSKIAAQSRGPSIYRKKSTELKENTLARPLAKGLAQRSVSSENENNHYSNIIKKLSTKINQPSNVDSSQLYPFNVCNHGQANNNVTVTARATGSVLSGMSSQDATAISPEVGNSQILNFTYPAITPPRISAGTYSQQVPFIPPTPGAFLLQQTSQQFSPVRSTYTVMANTPQMLGSTNQQYNLVHSAPICTNQQYGLVHSTSTCTNQQSSNVPVTPLKMNQQLGSSPSIHFNTSQHLVNVSGFPPTPAAFLSRQNSVPTSVGNTLKNTDSNNMQLSQPNSFSNGSLTMVTSCTDSTDSDAANVTMVTAIGQQAQGPPNTQGQSSVGGPDQGNMPIQKGVVQDVDMVCTCEIVEEGQSGGAVPDSQQGGHNCLLNSEVLSKSNIDITKSIDVSDTRSRVADLPGLVSPLKGELTLGDLSLGELQLRSPRRKCPQPKKRAVTTESPMKLVDGEQKSAKEDVILPGMSESGNVTMPSFIETLLGTPSLQEKLAENINKVVSRQDGPDESTLVGETEHADNSQQSLEVPVDDILELTQADPAFEALFTLFGTDALEDKEDCSVVTETNTCQTLPSVQSTMSDSATLVTDALLLLSCSPQSKGFQVPSVNLSSKEQTDTSPSLDSTSLTTNEINNVSHEPSTTISVSSTQTAQTSSTASINLGDTHSAGLVLPSTTSVSETNTISTIGKKSRSQVVKEAIRTKVKRGQRHRQPPPIESHVRSLNFGEVASGKSSQKKKPHNRFQGSTGAMTNTNSSALAQPVTCLASHQSNVSGSSNQDRGRFRTILPMQSGTVSSHLPVATDLSGDLSVSTSFNSISLIEPRHVETSQVQYDSQSAMCASPLQVEQETLSAAAMQLVAKETPITAPVQVTPQRTPNIAPVQAIRQGTLNAAPMEVTPQGTPNVATMQSTPQGTPNFASMEVTPQITPNIAPMQAIPHRAPNFASMEATPQGTPNVAPVQSTPQGTPNFALMEVALQGTPDIASTQAAQEKTPIMAPIQCRTQVTPSGVLMHTKSRDTPSTASVQTILSSSQHVTRSPEVISQTFRPPVTATFVHSPANICSVNEHAACRDGAIASGTTANCTENTQNHCYLFKPIKNNMTSSSNVNSPSVTSQDVGGLPESSAKSGARLRALQLTAEQDAKSLFGTSNTNWNPGTLSATEHMIKLSKQRSAREGMAVSTGGCSPLMLGYQTQDYGGVSSFSPIPRPSSAPTIGVALRPCAESSSPVAASLLVSEQGPITSATLPPSSATISRLASTQLTGNVSPAVTWAKLTSHDVPGKHNASFSFASSTFKQREQFVNNTSSPNTVGAVTTQTISGPASSSSTVSSEAASTRVAPAVKSSSLTIPSTLQQQGEQLSSYSANTVSTCSVAIVTSNSDTGSLNLLSSAREQSREFQSSDVVRTGPVMEMISERTASKLDEIQGGLRDLHSPVDIATDSPASSYCSEISSPNSSDVTTNRESRKRSRSTTPEPKKRRSKHSRTSKKSKKKLTTDAPRNLENLDVDKFLSKLHYLEK